jgi:hypothetical protein
MQRENKWFYITYKCLIIKMIKKKKTQKYQIKQYEFPVAKYLYYPSPKGDIEIVSVRPSFRPSVLSSDIFVRSISQKVFEVSIWNFIGRYIILRRNAVHKNDKSILHNVSVIVLCYFSNLIFVESITQKAYKISIWNFIGG